MEIESYNELMPSPGIIAGFKSTFYCYEAVAMQINEPKK